MLAAAAGSAQVEMAVAIPQQQTELSANTYNILRGKLQGAMTTDGVASAEYSSIVVVPTVSFANKQIVESGMRNITVADIQLTLSAEHLVTGIVFNSRSFTLRGEGTSTDQAVSRAISKLQPADVQLRLFISQSKQKIIEYYETNGNVLISKARSLAQRKQFDEAIALLDAYPQSLSGYSTVNKTLGDIFRQYQTSCCSELVQQARSEYAVGNYQEAARLLGQVDMQSACGGEAKALCQSIKNARDAEAARAAAAIERAYQTKAAIERQRIRAIRDVAVAYCKRQTKYYFVW